MEDSIFCVFYFPGLSVTSDAPTELGYNTTLTASITTGDETTLYTFDLGNNDVIADQPDSTLTYNYASPGQYNATITAANPAMSVSTSIQVKHNFSAQK